MTLSSRRRSTRRKEAVDDSQDHDVPSRMAIETTKATDPGTWILWRRAENDARCEHVVRETLVSRSERRYAHIIVGILRDPMKPSFQVRRI